MKQQLGARIKELRQKRGLSQNDLSIKIEVDPKHISRLETGINFPSAETFEKLAKALNVEIKDLFDFEHKGKTTKQLKKEIDVILGDADTETLELAFKLVKGVIR